MKRIFKSSIFVLLVLFTVFALSVTALASDAGETVTVVAETENVEVSESETSAEPSKNGNKLDQDLSGADMNLGQRFEYAMQGTATGMVMVFAVLGLLWGIVSLSRVIFYDIPNKKKAAAEKAEKKEEVAPVVATTPSEAPVVAPVETDAMDDGELAAIITAAVAAMLVSEEYKNEFVGGFRVVSFKRTSGGAWNRK